MCLITSDLGSFSAQREMRRTFWATRGGRNQPRKTDFERKKDTGAFREKSIVSGRSRRRTERTLWRHAGEMEARDGMYFRSDETYPVRHRFATTHLGLEVECKESVEDVVGQKRHQQETLDGSGIVTVASSLNPWFSMSQRICAKRTICSVRACATESVVNHTQHVVRGVGFWVS